MARIVCFLLLSIVALTAGCSEKHRSAGSEESESNPVKEYINVPKEKARDAREAIEKKQEEEQRQAEEFDEAE